MLGVLALQDNKVLLDKVAVRRCLALQHGRSALRHHHRGTGLFTRCARLIGSKVDGTRTISRHR